MLILPGNNTPQNLYVGNTPVQKLYRGSQEIWPNTGIVSNDASVTITTIYPTGTIFDATLAPASVPVAYTTDADDGAIVMARWLGINRTNGLPNGLVGSDTEINVVAAGQGEGSLPVPRGEGIDYRIEAWIAGSSAARAQTPVLWVGVNWAFWNQSNGIRAFGNLQPLGLANRGTVLDDEALTLYLWSSTANPTRLPVTQAGADAGTVSAASVAVSNVMANVLPGVRCMIASHTQVGTSHIEASDDSQTTRLWSNELALTNAHLENGLANPGLAFTWGWGNFAGSGPAVVDGLLPFMTGREFDGTPVPLGTTGVAGFSGWTMDHNWPEIYDMSRTKVLALSGNNVEATVTRWQQVQSDKVNWPEFAVNPQRVVYGIVYSGSHIRTDNVNGSVRAAKQLTTEALRCLGILDIPEPTFTNSDYSSGTHIDLWNPEFDVTTYADAAGSPAPYVAGFFLNGVGIRNEAQLLPNAGGSGRVGVRITPASGAVDYTTLVQFGLETAVGIIDPLIDGEEVREYVPIMNRAGLPIEGVNITPWWTDTNPLPAPLFFTKGTLGGFTAPSGDIAPGIPYSFDNAPGITVETRFRCNGTAGVLHSKDTGRFEVLLWLNGQLGRFKLDCLVSGVRQTVFDSTAGPANVAQVPVHGLNQWSYLAYSVWFTNDGTDTTAHLRISTDAGGNMNTYTYTALIAGSTDVVLADRLQRVLSMDNADVEYFKLWGTGTAAVDANGHLDTSALVGLSGQPAGTPDFLFGPDALGNFEQTPATPAWGNVAGNTVVNS